jgi:hypothetical protein
VDDDVTFEEWAEAYAAMDAAYPPGDGIPDDL